MARTLAMFTDTSLCIGCRACQVACKQWNELPMEEPEWTGSYQNHAHFTDKTYRLVRFIEKPQANGELQWLLMSDVCKHCAQAGCLDACPTGAIHRTEYGTVNISPLMPASAPAWIISSDSDVELVEAPAISVASGPTARRTARHTSTCSAMLSVGVSPVVPVSTRPSEPEASSAFASSPHAA